MIDLRPDHLEIVRDLLRQHVPECEVRAFGSRFKWTAKQASDLDLAVVGTKRLPTKKIMRLKEAFEESILPMRVDVLDWHAITPEFQRVIDAGFEVIQEGGEVSPLATASSPSAAVSSATPLDARAFSGLSSEQPNWPVVRLGDYADTCLGKMLDQNKNKGSFHPYLGNSDVRWGRFDLSSLSSMRFEDDEHERYGLKFGDLVVCEGGEPGRAAIWRDEIPNMKIQKALHRIRARDAFDNQFLYYWFLFAGRSGLLEPFFTGTTIKHLPGQALANLQVPKPPIEYQKSIAYVLGKLDDRIELCRRTNETLESTARALFKDWFIDFGPVRAKLEGGESYLSADVWSLFPDQLIESELGEIPEGWEYLPVSEIIEFNPTESLKKGSVAPYIDMAALPTVGGNTERPVLREFGSGMKFRNNDTLMARITPCLENGKTAYVQSLPKDAIGWGSTEFIVMRPKAPVPSEYAYILARDSNFRKHAIQSMTGTSGRQRAQATMVASYSVANATPKIWEAFSKAIQPWFSDIKLNSERIEILSSLRDSLLPKLISGELNPIEVDSDSLKID